MKKIFVLLFTQIIVFGLFAQKELIQKASDSYAKGEYMQAIDLYEQLLKENGESASIFYNIGNCYYKLNKPAPAILNYEKALLLEPGNNDIRFNLEVAKLKTIDKIEPVEDFFLSEWIEGLQNLFGTNQWAWAGIITFLLFIGTLILFFFSRKIFLKKSGFYAGIGLLVISICCSIFSYQQKKKLTDRDYAIVFAPTVTIKSSPDDSGTNLFNLHEGTKVKIKSKLGNWSEIEIEDGNVGWIKTSDIEII